MAPHSSTLAWKIPWMEGPGRLRSMGSLRVGHDWETSLSLFTVTNWRRKWQPTPVLLPGESQGQGSLVGWVYGVAQSRTRLKWLSSSSSSREHKKNTIKTKKQCKSYKFTNICTYTFHQVFNFLIQCHKTRDSFPLLWLYVRCWLFPSIGWQNSVCQSLHNLEVHIYNFQKKWKNRWVSKINNCIYL